VIALELAFGANEHSRNFIADHRENPQLCHHIQIRHPIREQQSSNLDKRDSRVLSWLCETSVSRASNDN
jgi:hypothetical protein